MLYCVLSGAGASIAKAVRLQALAGVDHVVVVDDDNVLVGVVSSRDIASILLDVFEAEGLVEVRGLGRIADASVAEVARKPVITVRNDPGPLGAAFIMHVSGIGVLPVVDDSGRVEECYDEAFLAYYLIGTRAPLAPYATRPVDFGEDDDTVLDAMARMLERGYRDLVYRVSGAAYRYGVTTLRDLLLLVARTKKEDALLYRVVEHIRPAVVVPGSLTVGEAAGLIASLPERAVLVNGSGELGIFTARDVVRFLARLGGV
ncbi:MAG: CBS domain-containing protein [Crenarchaeota archaeon]|nr:CBS domain-containing protein [Thermoproteota archaeon]